jgi:hypothetical protein
VWWLIIKKHNNPAVHHLIHFFNQQHHKQPNQNTPKHNGSARGIPADAARQALVRSFGAEVVQRLGHDALAARVQADVVAALRAAEADIVAGKA